MTGAVGEETMGESMIARARRRRAPGGRVGEETTGARAAGGRAGEETTGVGMSLTETWEGGWR
jgi:hypothetical protein